MASRSSQLVVVYLNGGDELSTVSGRVSKAGGKVLLKKTFLSKEAGHIAHFADTEGNRIGSQHGLTLAEEPVSTKNSVNRLRAK
jgi:uncharacterized protein